MIKEENIVPAGSMAMMGVGLILISTGVLVNAIADSVCKKGCTQ